MAVSVVDPDAILVREHLGGERDAFDVLYRRYFPRLVRLCTRLTKDGAAAEDIAQETLVRAHDHLERFDQTRPMWPWLKTMATRLFIDQTRGKARELPMEGRLDEGRHDEHGWNEEREVLTQALAKLSPRQRTAVALRYIEDWDGPEVAEFFGLSGHAVRQMLHRATRKLQTEYRKIAEPVMGAILLPVGWLRRMGHEVASRVRPSMTGPEAVRALAAVTALNLVVATAAVFGGAGHGAPPSASRSAPPNIRTVEPVRQAVTDGRGHSQAARLPTDGPSSPATSSQGPQAVDGTADVAGKAGGRGHDVASGLTDPNSDVTQPEDAELLSVAYSPRFSEDRTVYAAGVADCTGPQCPPVLFRSQDAGANWIRLGGDGFDGAQLLLPPAYGAGDDRIFAVGPVGLEVSEDGGASFHPAASGTPAVGFGSSAISPSFNSGDPTILIGDHSMMQYRDDAKVVGPAKPIPGRGPLHPTFSPAFRQDGLLLVGGLQVSGATWTPSVFRCQGEVCSGSPLPISTSEAPRVRPAPDFAQSNELLAFTTDGIFTSADRGASFFMIHTPWDLPLRDVVSAGGGRIFAAVRGDGAKAAGEFYLTADGGMTWALVNPPLLAQGVTSIQVYNHYVLTTLHGGGIACSADGGETWAARCPAA